MARTDRLMRLMDALRRLPAPVTAARLADETAVSLRQLYRDIATLRAGGALIDGEAGVGYRLTEDPALPPQSFTRLEIEALRLAVTQLHRMGDAALAEAGEAALSRIVATLPERQAQQALHTVLRSFAPDRADLVPAQIDLPLIRHACWDEVSLRITYRDLKDVVTTREIWPLAMSYSDNTLMLLAMCRLRMDFRFFHVPRIVALAVGGHSFRPQRVALIRDWAASRRENPGTSGEPAARSCVGPDASR